jgi:acyl-CoA thioesterase-1
LSASSFCADGQPTLLVYGDSLVAGLGLPLRQAFPARLEAHLLADGYNVRVINAGVSGETTTGARTRLEWTLLQNPDAVILESGGNDILRGIDPALTRQNLEAILKTLRARHIPVLLSGIRPFPDPEGKHGAAYRKLYADLARRYASIYDPFFLEGVAGNQALMQDDGLHPNARGVEVIVKRLAPPAENLLGRKRKTDP